MADAEGLEAVSIRRVAAELDARAMSSMTISQRELLAHPWAIFVAAERLGPGPNSVKLANDYVVGYSFRTVGTVNPKDREAAIAASDVVEFPELAALLDNLRHRSSIERFELGLQTRPRRNRATFPRSARLRIPRPGVSPVARQGI